MSFVLQAVNTRALSSDLSLSLMLLPVEHAGGQVQLPFAMEPAREDGLRREGVNAAVAAVAGTVPRRIAVSTTRCEEMAGLVGAIYVSLK